MHQSGNLRQELPYGFLKMSFNRWVRLGSDVRVLIAELAKDQRYKCAFCSEDRGLYIDHDHDPDEGPWDKYTIHNVRGLVCPRCNWHLMIYEKDEAGEDRGFENASCLIASQEYDTYIYAYHCRQHRLFEERLERTCPNYWARCRLLHKFEGWKDGWTRHYPWPWYFEEIKEKRHGKIRTPKQFIRYFTACLKFVAEQLEKKPDFEIPESFVRLMTRIKPVLDDLRPVVEARRKTIAAENN